MKQSWKWKILTPLQFLCVGRLPWGIDKNNHIWIGRCIVAMVTALYDVGLGTMFWTKVPLLKSKSKRVWFSGACEPIHIKLKQMREPLSQVYKIRHYNNLGFINKKKCSSYYVPCQPFRQPGKTSTTIFVISPKVLFPHKPNKQQRLHRYWRF